MQTMQNNQPVAATLQMEVTLEAQQWNQILGVLGEAPYRVAAPLIQIIGEQLQRKAQEQPPQGMQAMDTRPNGPVPAGPLPTFMPQEA